MTATKNLYAPETAYAHFLPYWWIGDEALVLTDGTLAVAYRIRGLDPTCLPDEQINALAERLRAFANALPLGLECQILRHSRPAPDQLYDSYLGALRTNNPILTEQRSRSRAHLRSLELRHVDTYLIFSRPVALGHLGSHTSSGITALLDRLTGAQPPDTITYDQHRVALDDLAKTADGLARHLRTAGLTELERLDDRRLTALVRAILNPSLPPDSGEVLDDQPPPGLAPHELQLYRPPTLREQLAFSDLHWDVDTLTLDDPLRPHRVMALHALQRRTIASLINGASRIAFPHWMSVAVAAPDSERKYSEVQTRRNRALAAAAGYARNIRASEQAEELQSVLKAMVSRDQHVFRLGLHLLFGADSLAELDARTRQARDIFRDLAGAVLATEQDQQLPAFLGMLPGNSHRAPHRRTMMTDNVADLLPVYDDWRGDARPAFLVPTRSHAPLAIDLADPRRGNWNTTIFGGTGGGKSFLTLSLATSTMLGQSSPLIVIDVGGKERGSYYRLSQLLGGDFVGLSVDGSDAINPFPSRSDLYSDDSGLPSREPHNLRLTTALSVAKLLVTDPGAPPLSRVSSAILQRAILAAYDRVGASRAPILSDLADELAAFTGDPEDIAAAKRFAKTLRASLDSPFGQLVNQQTRVNIRSSFVVFDLKGLEAIGDELASVMLLIVSGYVWSMIARPRDTLAWVVYDECWKLLQHPTAAELQSELYRTARKLRAGVVSITQKLDDFLAAPAARAILSNTSNTFLLRHKDGHAKVAELLGLNEREQQLFRSLKSEKGHYSEFLWKGDTGAAVARYAPTPFEYWVNTTDPVDRELEARVLQELAGDRLAAIRRLAAEYPHGAAAGLKARSAANA